MHSLVHIRRTVFNIPLAERNEEFARIDRAYQTQIELRLDLMESVHRARCKKAEYQRLAALCGGAKGYSPVNIKRMWLKFRASGFRWQALKPDYNNGTRGLPPEFIEHWRALVLSNQRCARPMWRQLRDAWRAGQSIPGYGTWMDHWRARHPTRPLPLKCPGLPHGWSYDNLMEHAPEQVQIDLVRDGEFAAHARLAQIQRDRSELRPLEYIAFDDVQPDFRCVSLEALQVVPLRGLCALDVGMACLLDHAAGPCVLDDKGTRKSIAYADMKRLLFRLLTTVGIPVGYKMHLMVENETATISKEDAALLSHISNGRIVVIYTPMKNRAVLAGGYRERHGSPQTKGWIESFFNLLHNELASLPGQFGKDPINAKAGDYEGRLAETNRLLRDVAALTPEVRSQLNFAFPTVEQGLRHLREAIVRINNRDDHRLQGFAEIVEWRYDESDPTWKPLALCKPELLPHVERRKRKETPMERLERGVAEHEFERISPASLAFLLNDKRTVTTTKPYEIAFQIGGKRRTFRNPQLEQLAKVGRSFVAQWEEHNLDRIYLFEEKGAWVGEARCVQAVNPLDEKALGKAIGEANQINAATFQSVRSTMAHVGQKRLADEQANNTVLARAALAATEPLAVAENERLAAAMASAAEDRAKAAKTAKSLDHASTRARADLTAALADAARATTADDDAPATGGLYDDAD